VFDMKKEEYFSNPVKSRVQNVISEDSEDSYKTPQVLIDQLFRLLSLGKFNEKMIKEQIETVLMAGSETSALSLSYVILMLAMHPNVQERLYEELHSVFVSQDEETSYEHLQQLTFLDRVINEVMRLFPSAPLIARCTRADVPISNCTVPKNAFIMMSIYNMHRKPEIWGDDADEFNPDHFLPEKVDERHPFAYLPFSGGKRNCIGYQYALLSIKVVLSKLFRQYRFTTDLKMTDLKLKFEVTLKLCNKHLVGLQKRVW
ncbi:probable cytochrome P450 313a4, partial [Sitodiplosis mosellana]|uniref:probable cytochrome P450 313a4 n=1 Tax=Sitodiplosis mosellana TaxID=263140 RepID=UPI002444514C